MNSSVINEVVEQMHHLPDDLQQEVHTYVVNLQRSLQTSNTSAWDVLESLTGTVEAPPDWSSEHNHYLYGTPKQQNT